jgi:hypothetical protein
LLIVELKKGKMEGGAIDQLLDYFGMIKDSSRIRQLSSWLSSNCVPEERQLACEKHDINCMVISEKRYRDVAAEVGYEIGPTQLP